MIASSLLAGVRIGTADAQTNVSWAAAFVRQAGNELSAIMANAHSTEERRERVQAFVDRVVDVDTVARFCLGRYWQRATSAQQKEYMQVFHAVLMNAVLSRVGDYEHNEVRINIDPPEQHEDGVYVPTLIERTRTPQVKVTWVVSADAANPHIVDVIAEGTSLRLTVRSDYSAFLNRHDNSIDALLTALHQQVCTNCTPLNARGGP